MFAPVARVGIVLPTYNRAAFLPATLLSVAEQSFTDWELVVVDDGGSDETADIVRDFAGSVPQSVRYVRQQNQGPAAARNTGIALIGSPYLAFIDSDDRWLAHHLESCVEALNCNPDVDWVYTATRIVEHSTGCTLSPNCFYDHGVERPFLKLNVERRGQLCIISDHRQLEVALRDALWCGLQTSVLRRAVFDSALLPPFRVGEDQVFSIICAAQGYKLAYFNEPQVIYATHGDNISAASGKSVAHNIDSCLRLAEAFESLPACVPLNPSETRIWRARVRDTIFWGAAYPLIALKRHADAQACFRRAKTFGPFTASQWKTYQLFRLRLMLSGRRDSFRENTFRENTFRENTFRENTFRETLQRDGSN